jgi:alkanesulfonate monooxygenase SsuD/methylene tetrahydromethanopterin reductase-like flavin-dependent oxidoreductase (luciferase family)/FAD/FMN-containing dehydrogenase
VPDYGQPLLFGTFITPTNGPGQQPVELAVLAEDLGFDLVTFQDHPYQPAFHDTWTLLAWVAARTERVHVSANVLNLPLRPPAVLARAAASLDLLSGGRVDLGLGAGGFWDGVEAMGGRRLTSGQAVDALSDGIDVIRSVWDQGDRPRFDVDGEYHRVSGAMRGPATAHTIPIWLGAYKPRMLRLTGRKADGWLPSLAYFKPGELRKAHAIVDAAAEEAGRDPRQIRRLLNVGGRFSPARAGMLHGPAEQWVEELLPLVLEDGVSTFILTSDDPATMRRFATEVVPGLRERAAAERGAGGAAGIVEGPVRGSAALAKRRGSIDYDSIPESLAADAVEPEDSGYSRVSSTYMRGGSPGLVLRPNTVEEVVDAVTFARANREVPLSVRSGGHGMSGRSTNHGGIVIDLKRLNAIQVLDQSTRRVRIGPGARWLDVASALEAHGWAITSGDYGGVGVGGLATAGGLGWFAREHGLTIDLLRAVEIVLADGSMVRASDHENPELFWAVRGAGANFGIVTAFEFEAAELGHDVGYAQLAFQVSDTAAFLHGWGAAMEAAPRDVTTSIAMGGAPAGQPLVAQLMGVVNSDDPDTVIQRLQPLAQVASLVDKSVQLISYSGLMANLVQEGDQHGQGEPHMRSGLIEHLTPEFAEAAAKALATGALHFFSLRSLGAAVADVGPDATAYGDRSANFLAVALGSNDARLDEAWAELRGFFRGMYVSFDTSLAPERLERAWPDGRLDRLRTLKGQYDPNNLFRDNFNVVPAA